MRGGPENAQGDPDNCWCPKCQPRQWLVVDLADAIRQRDDALDELVMAAELSCLSRDDRAFERLRKALTAWREASGDPR